ncbi:Euc1 protein [Maudiozyma humilis]|uniref:Euc1 protein n=1 Tax=Maudiozyma humilis TaxID=51915 RepID=A0AAV5RTQ3_MAUHU|nr:Euc1 protein [Kazachstania humilis]
MFNHQPPGQPPRQGNTGATGTAGAAGAAASDRDFRAFIIDQLTKIQEQNELLSAKVDTLEKEQEQYYLSGTKKIDSGFRDVRTCVQEVAQVKQLFKEVVGIMSGERVRFLDHSAENAVASAEGAGGDAAATTSSTDDSRTRDLPRRPYTYLDHSRERSIVQNAHRIQIKQESGGELGALPSVRPLSGPSAAPGGGSFGDRNALRGAPDEVAEDFAGNGQVLRISREQVLNDQRDIDAIMEAQRLGERELENALRIEQAMSYKMNRAIQSVYDVAKEYYEGFPGKPSLLLLDRRFGSTWRRQRGERTMFAKRKCIINRIEEILKDPQRFGLKQGLRRNEAIKVVENMRLGNNLYKGHVTRLSLPQLYEYISRKMDRPADYAMHIKERGLPRREILMRERASTMMGGTRDPDADAAESPSNAAGSSNAADSTNAADSSSMTTGTSNAMTTDAPSVRPVPEVVQRSRQFNAPSTDVQGMPHGLQGVAQNSLSTSNASEQQGSSHHSTSQPSNSATSQSSGRQSSERYSTTSQSSGRQSSERYSTTSQSSGRQSSDRYSNSGSHSSTGEDPVSYDGDSDGNMDYSEEDSWF